MNMCSVETIRNTTLCKLHKGTNGFRPMGTNADHFPSCSNTLFQGEARCEAIDIKTIFVLMQIDIIFIRKVFAFISIVL